MADIPAGLSINLTFLTPHYIEDLASFAPLAYTYFDVAAYQEPGGVAVGETVILLHSPLPLVGTSIVMEWGCQQNDSLADG